MTVQITRHPAGWRLEAEQHIGRPREDVFDFFADAANLQRITPAGLRFRILSPQPIRMRRGARIAYRLGILGLPVRWESVIAVWEPPARFVDEQARGPFRWWRHEHAFVDAGGGTRVRDRVEYGVPGGRVVHALAVAWQLRWIFGERQRRLAALLKGR